MNAAPVYEAADGRYLHPALPPTRQLLLVLIKAKSGGAFNARAEHLDLRARFRGWPTPVIEQLLGRLLARAERAEQQGFFDSFERRHAPRDHDSLARANGRHQPDSGRDLTPETPAARERVCPVGAAVPAGGDMSARASVQQQTGEVVA